MNNELILRVDNVSKSFPGVRALSNVSLELHKGEVLGLIGENGAGKSTLMNILLGSLKPDSGSITYKNRVYSPRSPADALSLGISMIHQELTLVPEMSVAENIWLGCENRFSKNGYINISERRRATSELLSQLGIELKINVPVSRLSVAEMQLTELARAVSYNSDIIIMDEPTSSFTNKEIQLLFKIIQNLKQKGISIIFISHKLDEIFTVCDNITVLRDGQVVNTVASNSVNEESLISMMVGRNVENLYPKIDVEIGEPVFSVTGLTRAGYFEDINFEVRRGEIFGFCGLVGAGRSEIMECIFGIEHADAGEIYLNGNKLNIRSTKDAVNQGIAMVTEDRLHRGLIHEKPISFNMSLAYLDKIVRHGFVNRKKETADCKNMGCQMNLKASSIAQQAGTLSGGNQQKVIIGKWLLTQPEVFILDEPTRGIDVGAKAEIYSLIGELVRQGKAILLVSSELPELIGLCDRITVICQGKQAAVINRDAFDPDNIMKYAFGQV